MVTEIKCECGCIHSSKIKMEITDDLSLYLTNYCDNNICNGKILIIGEERYLDSVKVIQDALQKDYKIKRFIYADNTEFDRNILADMNTELDECRLIIVFECIALSSMIREMVKNLPVINVFSDLNIRNMLTCKGEFMLIDRNALNASNDCAWAGYYGQLIMLLLNCLDYTINQKFEKGNQCMYLIKNIEKEISKLIQIEYDDFDGVKFKNNLTEIVMQTALWLTMLDNFDFINGYEIITDNLKSCYDNYSAGELQGVLAWYIYNKYKVYTRLNKIDCLLPCDRIKAIEYLSKNIGYDKLIAFSKLKVLSADELAKRHFIYLEYRLDILEVIERFDSLFEIAIKNFRRIYADVGYSIKKDIAFEQLSNISDCSAGLMKEYSLFKHFFEIGYLSKELI